MKKKLEDLKRESILVHGEKYDYSLIEGEPGTHTKVPIICPTHGVFYKDFYHHIHRCGGCPACSNRERYTKDGFIKKLMTLKHCEKYSFEKTEYKRNKEKVIITCHEKDENGLEHGDFTISPGHLLGGEGCPKCRYIKASAKNRRSLENVIDIAKKVHGDKYDYSLITEYKNDRTKYPIICPEHGVFYQAFNNHIKGKQGCPICGRAKCDRERALTLEEWKTKANLVHSEKYDYSLVDYVNGKNRVKIICPEHGVFEQIAGNHLFGAGCPLCFKDKSKVEKEIFEYVSSLLPGVKINQNDRTIISPREIDVFIPSLKIGFEMNGLIWHSEKFNEERDYHKKKTDACESLGIKLIQIFDDEWILKNAICKSRIKNILNLTENRVYARNCTLKEISSREASTFLENNHLQGKTQSSIRIGLYFNGELVSVMTFAGNRINVGGKKKDGEYELVRFANKIDTSVIGGASKIFKYFIEKYKPTEVKSFADRRWSNGNLYETLGFRFSGNTEPNYFYVVNKKRVNRFSMRKDVLVKKYGCPENITEKKFCESNGWYRIYDSGSKRYVWKR